MTTSGVTTHLWLDGRRSGAGEGQLPLLTHALHYGTGVFEGIRCYATAQGPALFRLDEHLERLAEGAAVLGMELAIGDLTAAVLDGVVESGFAEAYVRPVAFYGAGHLGLDVEGLPLHLAVAVLPWTSHLGARAAEEGIAVQLSGVERNRSAAIPPLKLTGAYVNSVLAKRAARRAGYDEAFFLDEEGRVLEATGENVFLVVAGRVVAVEHPDALPGITRRTVVELTRASSRPVDREELFTADEIFVTGTSAEVTPVTRIDGRRLPIGPVTREVQRLYRQAVRGELAEARSWLTPVESARAVAS